MINLKTGKEFDNIAVKNPEYSSRGSANRLSNEITKTKYPIMPDFAWWSGEWNIGFDKHSSSPTKWIDLTENGYDFIVNNGACSWCN